MKRSAVMNTTLRPGARWRTRHDTALSRWSCRAPQRVNEQRIEVERLAARCLGDAHGGGMGERIERPTHEGLEGQRMIERRTAVAGPLAAAIGAIAIGAKALIGAVMARRAVAAEAAGGVAEAVCGRSCGRARTGRPRVRT